MSERVRVPVRASRALPLLLLSAHLLALAGLILSGAPAWFTAVGAMVLATSFFLEVRAVHRTQPAHAIVEITDERACVVAGGIRELRGLLRADSIALPWLVILRIDCEGSRRVESVVLMRDSASADDWRRLRVFLRWGVRFGGAAPAPSDGPR
jgi:toxin CptA